MAIRDHITAPQAVPSGALAVALLREMLDHTDVIIQGADEDGGIALLVLAPPELRERLEMFEAETEDDEDDDPDGADEDPGGGNVEDEGEPGEDDEPNAETEEVDRFDEARRLPPPPPEVTDWPHRANGFVRRHQPLAP